MLLRGNSIRLFNADGSEPEMSGNGTRCAAALLIDSGRAAGDLTIQTGAGPKHLRLVERVGRRFVFEMDMGRPVFHEHQIRSLLPLRKGPQEVTILDVGNPQCVIFVERFPSDWETSRRRDRRPSAISQAHQRLFRPACGPAHHRGSVLRARRGRHAELGHGINGRGGGGDSSEGGRKPRYGSTPAGESLQLRWDDSVYLTGPAEIVGSGEFYD